jgi:hypothetical protein
LDWTVGLIFDLHVKRIFYHRIDIPCHVSVFCDFISEHCLMCTRKRLVAISQEYYFLHLNYFRFLEIETLYLRHWPHFITGVKSLKAKETPVSRIEYNTKHKLLICRCYGYSLLAYVLNFGISVCMAMGVGRSIIWGGADIYIIFMFTNRKNNQFH